MFKQKDSTVSLVGIYLIYDPAVLDKQCKFSPPFFSPNDSIACQGLLETLRRHCTSFDQLYKSDFRRMDLWRIGSVDLSTGKVVADRKHRYKVDNVGFYLDQDFVKHYMMSVPYPSESEVIS